jgi:hypothetical protein
VCTVDEQVTSLLDRQVTSLLNRRRCQGHVTPSDVFPDHRGGKSSFMDILVRCVFDERCERIIICMVGERVNPALMMLVLDVTRNSMSSAAERPSSGGKPINAPASSYGLSHTCGVFSVVDDLAYPCLTH